MNPHTRHSFINEGNKRDIEHLPWTQRDSRSRDGKHQGKGPIGYRQSDARTYQEVCEALTHSDEIDASEINVEVRHGVVWLVGKIPDLAMKRLAADCILSIVGVHEIKNELSVKVV